MVVVLTILVMMTEISVMGNHTTSTTISPMISHSGNPAQGNQILNTN